MDVYQRRRLVALSAVAAIFVILVLLVRSCGGDEEEAPITPVVGATGGGGAVTLSASDFAAQGDAICLDTNTLFAQTEDAEASSGEAGEVVAGELAQLQSLPQPAEDKDRLQEYFGALQDQVRAYEERQTAAERGDDATVAEIDVALDEATSAAAKAARRFGFEVCGDRGEVSESAGGNGDVADTATTETEAPADTSAPVEPVEPAPTEVVPATPPADTGGGTAPAPAPAPAPTDAGGSGSGGITP